MAPDCIGRRVADWARPGTTKLPCPVDIIVEFSFEVPATKTILTNNKEIEMRCLLKMLKMEAMI